MNNESYDFEDRKYVNPTLSRDEQLSFIDNFRNTQRSNVDEITRTTHDLGTDVPSNLGGLTGAEDIWTSNHVTPKVNSMISGLRATAQAQALNDVLNNYQAQVTKRYNDSYRAKTYGTSTGNSNGGSDEDTSGDVDYEASDAASDYSNTGGGSDLDTVTPKTNTKRGVSSTTPSSNASGGSSLFGTNSYYLIAPNGAKTQVNINVSNSGSVSMDTPIYSIGGRQNVVDRLDEYIQKGYRVQLPNGSDVTKNYKQTVGL